ncbi:hypothetical protein Nepgr_023168 [Nepenthes gracilis]|uniref:Uncharacterized protein n=1 Tax=Nepenthes gracilis TaxID=150966 RepID=A0AAD3T2B8_NEPGR|nr:hypothetical protein Nepgr_023168 [Nepenthes gracilis]
MLMPFLMIASGRGSLPSMEGLNATINSLYVGNLLGKWVLLLVARLMFRKLPSVLLLLEYFVGWSAEFTADSVAPGYGRTIVSGDQLLEVVGVVGGAAMHLLARIVALLLFKGMAERCCVVSIEVESDMQFSLLVDGSVGLCCPVSIWSATIVAEATWSLMWLG